ncbi:hypothetical protein [Clostridium tetani]|nr:hypothetical protein [Clostridium tetani]
MNEIPNEIEVKETIGEKEELTYIFQMYYKRVYNYIYIIELIVIIQQKI